MSSLVRAACNRAAVITIAAGVALSAVAAKSEEYETVTVALADQQITFPCAPGKAEEVNDRFYACKALFDNDSERELANEYCKPLAIAQACSHKPVTLTH